LLKTLLLFDIDGTLLRAEGASLKAAIRTFQDLFGIQPSIDIISLVGRTDYGIFKDAAVKLLGRQLLEKELEAIAERYLKRLPGELEAIVSFWLMPGVKELLPLLAAREDVILGLETGNLEPAAYMKLKRGGIDGYFSLGGFGSDSEERTEIVRIGIERAHSFNHDAIPDENIFVIGDSPHDISAGRKLGVNTIAVGTGLVDREKLMAESPSHYLKDLSDIPAFMGCIGF
jgi:phosphoglycolate phosphatase